jgi:hypothetical protein
MKWLGIALALLALALIIVVRSGDEKKLAGAEIRAMHSGHTLGFEASTGSTGEVSYKSDGTMAGRKDSGVSDVGKWWVKDDKICRQWDNWRGGEWHCFDIFETSEKSYKVVWTDGGSATKSWATRYKSWMIR